MNNPTFEVDVHHVTRVEGHGNIYVNVNKGIIEKCEWSIPEAPRFFEAMVVGQILERTPPHYIPHMRHLLHRPLTCFPESHRSST